MLRALRGAQHEAVLQAEIPPSPSGSLPTPLSTIPTSPWAASPYLCLGVAVVLENQDTPLHPPSGRGDKRRRQANHRPHVQYWRELLAYIDATYRKKFGRHYPWNNLARKNLWNMARALTPWEVMALWDLYLESESWWAVQTTWSVYGMICDAGRLMDNSRLKQVAFVHKENLARKRYGRPSDAKAVFSSLFSDLACKLTS
jgi:hypothetical protein